MFFCGGGEFIVKTIRPREARVLHGFLRTYSRYLKQNRSSLLCRFLGSYSLEMFSQTFYFVVMLNCFDPHAYINERLEIGCLDNHFINDWIVDFRFDIKGSWVNRSAEPSKKSKRVVCRHCNEYFIPNAKVSFCFIAMQCILGISSILQNDKCKAVVGNHEANVVLKDNDLRTKISLPLQETSQVMETLRKDSDLLGKLGVMDYRLPFFNKLYIPPSYY